MGKHINRPSGRSYGDGKGAGYMQPPGAKWAKGQSGNPSGKKRERCPEKLEELSRVVWNTLETEVPTQSGGRTTYMAGIILSLCRKAATDPKTALKLFPILMALPNMETAAGADEPQEELGAADEAIVQNAVDRGVEAWSQGQRAPAGAQAEDPGDE